MHNFNFLTCIELCVPARHLQDIPCIPTSSTGFVLRISPFLGTRKNETHFSIIYRLHFHRRPSSLSAAAAVAAVAMGPCKAINFHFHFIVFILLRSFWAFGRQSQPHAIFILKLILPTPTSMHPGACCFGLRKNVPSTSGYLSKTNIGSSQSTHDTRLF